MRGGYSGNLKSLFDYLAGQGGRKDFESDMDMYFVNIASRRYVLDNFRLKDCNILESYYYIRKEPNFIRLAKEFGNFLLDSGAFTFMNGTHDGTIDWDAYTEEYAQFVKAHDINLYLEMDIDSLVGLDEVERFRRKLESITGRKPIPVWHKNRGKDYFINMCEEYPYVAIGGIVTKEIPRDEYEKAFPWFINEAHKRGCKIHGLGYTSVPNLKKYHFDSIDSTAWLSGNRGGFLYRFNPRNGTMGKIEDSKGRRLSARKGAVHNFLEWVKFSNYAKIYL